MGVSSPKTWVYWGEMPQNKLDWVFMLGKVLNYKWAHVQLHVSLKCIQAHHGFTLHNLTKGKPIFRILKKLK